MKATSRSRLPSAPIETRALLESLADARADEWPSLPTETELYILPDGQVVIADLPVELQPLLAALGRPVASEIEPLPRHD